MLSLAKLAGTDQRYYLDQAGGRVDHAGSVASGVEDYYLGGPEAAGRWTGSAAPALGLDREVSEAELRAVLSQQDPRSGEKLPGPAARARVPGYDLMFSVPKSASILFGLGDARVQEAVIAAQEVAVAAGLEYLERHACRTRRGAGGCEVIEGQGFVGAAFRHRTSRAGDPQLHTHVLIANATRRPDEAWGSLDGRALYAEAKTAGYIHEAVFRRELATRLGIRWGRVRNGIADIDGVPARVIDAFSRRRAEIEAQVQEWGHSSAGARQSAALATRARKDYGVTPEALAPEWRERAARLGLDPRALAQLLDRATYRSLNAEERAEITRELLAPSGLTAQASTFDRRDIVRGFSARATQGADLHEIEQFVRAFISHADVVALATGAGGHVRGGDVIRRADGRVVAAVAHSPRYSTIELLATEQEVVDAALTRRSAGAGVANAQDVEGTLAARPTIGADQAEMVRRLCLDGDAVQVVVGPAGTGKTFALDAAREAWETSGFTVYGAAVARQAARGLWDAAGIQSTSVAALLAALRRGDGWRLTERSVLVLDEAGMVGTRDLAEILAHATPAGTKVVLVGDHHQLPEIDAGGIFRALASRLRPITLTVNRRQEQEHARRMLDLWRAGRVRDAVEVVVGQGELVMAASAAELEARMVTDYCAALNAGEDAVMITQYRADARMLNDAVRARLEAAGRLGRERLELAGGEFAVGDRVVLRRNSQRLGVDNGSRGDVVGVDSSAGTLTIALAGGRTVRLPSSYLHGRTFRGEPTVVHGHAATAHVVQGATTERAFVLGSDMAYREWGYVAWSRARSGTRFYVCEPDVEREIEHHTADDSKHDTFEALVRALERSEAQHAAVDLVDSASDTGAQERRVLAPQRSLEEAQRAAAQATAQREAEQGRASRFLRRRTSVQLARLQAIEAHAHRHSAERAEALHEARAAAAREASPAVERPVTRHVSQVDEQAALRARARQLGARRATQRCLIQALGERPEDPRSAASWDRTVAHIERFREQFGITDENTALGERPGDVTTRLVWLAARRAIEDTRRELGRSIGHELDR